MLTPFIPTLKQSYKHRLTIYTIYTISRPSVFARLGRARTTPYSRNEFNTPSTTRSGRVYNIMDHAEEAAVTHGTFEIIKKMPPPMPTNADRTVITTIVNEHMQDLCGDKPHDIDLYPEELSLSQIAEMDPKNVIQDIIHTYRPPNYARKMPVNHV